MFDDEFSLEDVKNLIITLNINPEIAINGILEFLRDNYGKDHSLISLFNNQNGNISKRMSYYIDNEIWFIRVRKEKGAPLLDNDCVIINIDTSGTGTNKVVFAVETMKNQLTRIQVCPMHQSRLDTQVSLHFKFYELLT